MQRLELAPLFQVVLLNMSVFSYQVKIDADGNFDRRSGFKMVDWKTTVVKKKKKDSLQPQTTPWIGKRQQLKRQNL